MTSKRQLKDALEYCTQNGCMAICPRCPYCKDDPVRADTITCLDDCGILEEIIDLFNIELEEESDARVFAALASSYKS